MANIDSRGSGPGPDSPTARVLEWASQDISVILRRLLDEPPSDVSRLREEVGNYMAELVHLSEEMEFLDLKLAKRIARQCDALLEGLEGNAEPEIHRLVQAAARYFVMDDDAEEDTSPIGFDDDAEVVKWVARAIGREDVLDL